MDEEKYTRNKGRTKEEIKSDDAPKSGVHAGKLKNETSRGEAMKGKFRTGKKKSADVSKIKAKAGGKNSLIKPGIPSVPPVGSINFTGDKFAEDNNSAEDMRDSAGSLGVAAWSVIHKKMTVVEDVHVKGPGSQATKRGMGKITVNGSEGAGEESGGYASKMKPGRHPENRRGRSEGRSSESRIKSKELQKRNIQRKTILEYQAKKGGAVQAGNYVGTFFEKVEALVNKAAEAVMLFVKDNPLFLGVSGVVMTVVLVLSGALSSCAMIAAGGNNMIVTTSYTAQDDEIVSVESDYTALEDKLQEKIDNIPNDYPGYDEYKYSLSGIGHDPYELAALLTVLYEDYSESEVQDQLKTIKDHQYTLTLTPVVEKRTRTEERTGTRTIYHGDGTTTKKSYTYEVEVEYDYHILKVSLTNNGIEGAVSGLGLTDEQLQRYAVILELKGNKPGVFGDAPYTG